jgi:hypothetical protein
MLTRFHALAASAAAAWLLAGCNSAGAPSPGAGYEQRAPQPAGTLATSNETVSGLTSAECLRRLNAGEIDSEACLEPGI